MTFIARMLRSFFWLAVVTGTVALLRKIVGDMAVGGASANPQSDDPNAGANQKLVRDPICGMHIAEGLAVPLRQGGETVHFCSTECRDKYSNGIRELSASA
jgi:YHS domain-containing protein